MVSLCSCCLVTKLCPTFLNPYQPTSLLCPWDFPGKNTRVGSHLLLQGISLTQGSDPRLLHWQAKSLLLGHQASPVPVTDVCTTNVCSVILRSNPNSIQVSRFLPSFSFSLIHSINTILDIGYTVTNKLGKDRCFPGIRSLERETDQKPV